MQKYKIADVVFQTRLMYDYTCKLFSKYEYLGGEAAEFTVEVTAEDVAKEKELAPEFKDDYLENLVVLRRLCDYVLLNKNGLIFHSSAIMVDGKAYLFTAPSGTGKSTHAALWRKLLKDRAVTINDDKPIVRLIDGEFFVYGTPWNGKHNLGANVKAPVNAICLLHQAKENRIELATNVQKLAAVFNQTVRPTDEKGMNKLLDLVAKLIEKVPIYSLGCNVSIEAAKLSFETMSKEKMNED